MLLPRLRDLLADLDAGTHASRCRRVVEIARAHRGTAPLGTLLDGLAAHSDYHSVLAVIGAAASGDTDRLRRLAGHPAPRVARAAQTHLPLEAARDLIVERYRQASPNDRTRLRRRLGAEQRTDVVDALIGQDLADRERAALLATASAESVATHLPDLADLVPNPVSLISRHPRLVLDHLRRRVTGALAPVRDHWWAWVGPAVGGLVAHDAGAVLDLLEAAGPSTVLTPPVETSIGALIRHDPHRTAVLIAHPDRPAGQRLPPGLLEFARRFSPDDRVLIATRLRDDDRSLGQFLDALPPSERADTFRRALADVGVAQRVWGEGVLEALPHAVRHQEARRILALPDVRDDTVRRMHYQSYLPASEAAPLLRPALHAADPGERAAAYDAMVLAGARDRDPRVLAEALASLGGLRNEQDPVRIAAAEALGRVAPWLLAAAGIGPIGDLADAAAAARDTSSGTLRALQHATWRVTNEALRTGDDHVVRACLAIVDTLAGPTGMTTFPPFHGIPRGRERLVVDALLPRIRTAARKDDYDLLFALSWALGDRGWGVPEIDDLLRQALRAPKDSTVRTAAELWLADPHTRSARVGEALRIDESLAVLPVVQANLSHSRQDLLEVLWKRSSLAGRLWGRKPGFVPVLEGPFGRWLPRQLEAYAAALAALIATPGTGTWTATGAIRTLGRLPGIGASAVAPYADSPDLAWREAVLAALDWTDRPGEALARLLAVRAGDEVRVAMYAAGRCLRDVPGAVARPLIADVLLDPAAKVTARKEAVRLLGRIREPAAFDLLVAIGLDDETHRDVRIAAARTLRAWLDEPRAWEVLERVSRFGREEALSLAETTARQLAERHRPAYAALLLPGSATGETQALIALGAWAPWLPESMAVLAAVVAESDGPAGAAAVAAVRDGLRHGADWSPVTRVIADLAGISHAPDAPEALADADLPARQRLSKLVLSVSQLPAGEVGDHRARLVDTVGVLAAYPDLRGLALSVAARAVDWDTPGEGLARLVELVDEPLRCADLRRALDAALPAYARRPGAGIARASDDLLAVGSLPSVTAALSIIAWTGPSSGWNEEWRDRIRRLRRHPSPTIAGWARDVVTAPA